MPGTLYHDNNTHNYITASLKTNPTKNDFIRDLTSVGAIGGSRTETETTTLSTIGKDKSLGTIDNGTFDASGYNTEGQYTYFMNLLNLNKEIAFWSIDYDDDDNPTMWQRCRCMVSKVSNSEKTVDGVQGFTVTFAVKGIVITTPFTDPMGSTSGIPIEKITVAGFGGKNTITEKGGTLLMIAEVEPFDASDPAYSWSVDDEDTASINIGGRLMAKANGEVTVTAHAEDGSGVTGELKVTITGQTESV